MVLMISKHDDIEIYALKFCNGLSDGTVKLRCLMTPYIVILDVRRFTKFLRVLGGF